MKLGLGMSLRLQGRPFGGLDPDAAAFILATGATDAAAIDNYVRGHKERSMWADSVAWPLRSARNHGTGVTARSLGGLGAHPGTLTNGPTWAADGIVFDGVDDMIEVADASALRAPAGGLTLAAWVQATANSTFQFVAGKAAASIGILSEYYLIITNSNRFRFIGRESTASATQLDTAVIASGVHFVVAWHDPVAQTLNIQLNGTAPVSTPFTPAIQSGTNPFFLGRGNNVWPFNGRISWVAKYNQVLTADQRSYLFNGGSPLL